ncbi:MULTISPECIES: alpha-amylase family glycosyl hydrolase [unclassified Mesotoga]|uniref:alpha-amylase family glycosyl hydrolase n=1 Tax=unclassified Mesotoga TaxID=1184398 RepID=UPI000EF215DD|nr:MULTISPECIES: alpha-amylase family glycosyl hydrolase [unclassified Mesotoga]MDD4207882.1 alpha-amylase family glycosyl hydrolase [Mesotoga sp.]MDI9368252.1 alpha-amylase family glycosyl hydrolase [Thermotogota bacterium]
MILDRVLRLLKGRKEKLDYSIPKEWLPAGYSGTLKLRDRYIFVDPYEYSSTIVEGILSRADQGRDYSKSLGRMRMEKDSTWVNSAIIYGSFVRSTTAYSHHDPEFFSDLDSQQYSESGTFLKMIFMLPYLERMGFDTLYFLPVTSYSDKFKKGELGSPYSVKDFFSIDERYHDRLLGDMNVEEEFTAFVEAAHIMGMRVVLDFIPRTSARDSALILKNPEWFYWIDASRLKDYKPPRIEGLGFDQARVETLPLIYSNENVRKHLSMFRDSPEKLNPEKWRNFVSHHEGNENFLDELVKEFGLITPPGFSDWINDNQPTWDDITFLRLYKDHPTESRRFLPESQPPYVLFDVVKSSFFPGSEPMSNLWESIENIMPFYNEKFGVDGARLDMGHALPRELELRIIRKAKERDPSFAIIAEELVMGNDEKARRSGYDCILGNTWWMEPRINEGKLKELLYEVLPSMRLPTLAGIETPDTPRAAARKNGRRFSRFATILNYFLPHGITYINSGQEIFEIQPMNLGLDNDEEGRYVLPPNDPFYGKLAFFDPYVLHWNADDDLIDLISLLSSIRRSNLDLLNSNNPKLLWEEDKTSVGLFYWNGVKGLLMVANGDFEAMKEFHIDLGFHTWRGNHKVQWKLKGFDGQSEWDVGGDFHLSLGPGEVAVAEVR